MDPARHGLSSSHNTHPRLAQSAHGESMAPVVAGCPSRYGRTVLLRVGTVSRLDPQASSSGQERPHCKATFHGCVLSKSNVCERPCEWELAWHVLWWTFGAIVREGGHANQKSEHDTARAMSTATTLSADSTASDAMREQQACRQIRNTTPCHPPRPRKP